MLLISQLYIYPIKSLGGIRLEHAALSDRGLQYDRRFMLIDVNNRFLSQREVPAMSLLQPVISGDRLFVFQKRNSSDVLELELTPAGKQRVTVDLFEDSCEAALVDERADRWFSAKLGIPCRLVYMPDQVQRFVNEKYAIRRDITSLSDGFPVLIIGRQSLADLNERLDVPLPMDRFRPNIVFEGGLPFEEDTMKAFEINGIRFFAVKPCARCVITTINQESGEKTREPLLTLSKYRRAGNKIYFGQNVLMQGLGKIHIGDELKIIQRQPHLF